MKNFTRATLVAVALVCAVPTHADGVLSVYCSYQKDWCEAMKNRPIKKST
jgi:hypothetical protein